MEDYPASEFAAVEELDPEFWALESHKLAVRYGYRGVNGKDDRGRNIYLESGGTPSEFYLEQAQKVVRQRLALSGYRLGRMLNQLFGNGAGDVREAAVLAVVQQFFDAMISNDAELGKQGPPT